METISSVGKLACFKRGQTALQNAKRQMEQNEDYESIRTLVEFMISFKGRLEDLTTEIIQFLIKYILPPLKYEEDFSEEDYMQRMGRLTIFMKAVLSIPKDEDCVAITNEMSESFRKVVRYVGLCISKLRPIGVDIPFDHDLGDDFGYFIPPESHHQVHLGLNYWPALHKLIGPSQCAGRLYAFRLTQSIRLISILFGINNHWGTLFGSLTKRQIVPNYIFQLFDFTRAELRKLTWTEELQGYYPFLFKSDLRQNVYRENMVNVALGKVIRAPFDWRTFKVSRTNTLENIPLFLTEKNTISYWYFTFINEKGKGPGPTREFYAIFSQEFKRYDLNLWIGESQLSSDGIKYVNSPCGLFPSPCLQLDDYSRDVLTAIGKLMAKSLMDDMMMDLNFSSAIYKYLVEGCNYVQCLNLNDLKDVMPSQVNFVDDLVEVMNEASRIKNDTLLTTEQQLVSISNLTCDGCLFEDLCVNFTVPGFPDIEMVEGGSEKLLRVEDIEEYLQLLVWWLLYKGPQEKLECIRAGYATIFDEDYFVSIVPEDLDNMLCGSSDKSWSIDELNKNTVLCPGLYKHSGVIKHLFQVISTFSYEQKKQFLKFVTGSANLPVGGLSSLSPTLTIESLPVKNNPNNYFPEARVCVNRLVLPNYTSQDILRTMLLRVFVEGGNSFQLV